MGRTRQFGFTPLERAVEDHLSQMDAQMSLILAKKNVSDAEKAVLYLQILQKYVKFPFLQQKIEEMEVDNTEAKPVSVAAEPMSVQNPLSDDDDDDDDVVDVDGDVKPIVDVDKEVIDATIGRWKRQAENNLKIIKDNDSLLSWSPDQQLIYKGRIVPHTNIVDLITDLTNESPLRPYGHELFYQALNEMNFPINFIKNKYVKFSLKKLANPVKQKLRNAKKTEQLYAKPIAWEPLYE